MRGSILAILIVLCWAEASLGQTFVLGGPGSLEGKFEDSNGVFDDQGWLDVRCLPDDLYWQVSTFSASNLNDHGVGNHALWAGQTAAQQPDWSNAPGYGNGWMAAAEWRAEVEDPNLSVTVEVEFFYNFDTEAAYDFLMLEWHDGTFWQTLLNVSGSSKNAGNFDAPGEHFLQNWVIQPSQLVGPNQNEVRLRLFVRSDGGVSDEGGYLGFDSDGAAQVDDILVTFDGVPVDGGGDVDGLATFEAGDDEGWTPMGSPCVCALLSNLPVEYDPLLSNPTPTLGRVLDASLRIAGRCSFTSPEFNWAVAQPLDGSFLEFDSFFWSTGRLGFTTYQVRMTWRVMDVWQPSEVVFVGEVPVNEWQKIHVDLTGIAPVDADAFAMAFETGFGDGLRDIIAIDNVTAVRYDSAVTATSSPSATKLLGVHPNPANPRATVSFRMERPGEVRVDVYDLRGRRVRRLFQGFVDAGYHEEPFDGRDDHGRSLASGIYLLRLNTPSETFARRVTVVK